MANMFLRLRLLRFRLRYNKILKKTNYYHLRKIIQKSLIN